VRLGFDHPISGHRVEITSGYPPDLAHALDLIRGETADLG